MTFEKGHKPIRTRPVSDAVKRLEASRKGAGKIESKAQLKHILANANRGETAERNVSKHSKQTPV